VNRVFGVVDVEQYASPHPFEAVGERFYVKAGSNLSASLLLPAAGGDSSAEGNIRAAVVKLKGLPRETYGTTDCARSA
jgi:hypothetical protein